MNTYKMFLFLHLLAVLIIQGCSETQQDSNNNRSHEKPIAADWLDGEEIEIERATHGDTPRWLQLWEKEGEDMDMEEFVAIMDLKDELDLDFLSYKGKDIWQMDPVNLATSFELSKSQTRGYEIWAGDMLSIMYKRDTLNSISKFDLEDLVYKDASIQSYTIEDFKKLFPKSYAIRNYYNDSYMLKLMNDIPRSYDHLIMATSLDQMFLHVRFIDKEVVDVVLDRDRGY